MKWPDIMEAARDVCEHAMGKDHVVRPFALLEFADDEKGFVDLSPTVPYGAKGKDIVEAVLVSAICRGATRIAYVTEAWFVKSYDDDEKRRLADELAKAQRLEEHPDAKDMLLIVMYDEGGETHAHAPLVGEGDARCIGPWELHKYDDNQGRFARLFAKARGDQPLSSEGVARIEISGPFKLKEDADGQGGCRTD